MAQKQYPLINNFSRGELSSRMEGRVDIPDYYNGCKIMENCIMVAQGGAEKRPGTIFIDEVYKSNGNVRLLPFEVSDTEIYMIELGDQYMRFWTIQTYPPSLVEVSSGKYVLEVPYMSEHLSSIQYAQSEGFLYLTHQAYAIRFIKKDDDGFSLSPTETPVQTYIPGKEYHFGEVVIYNKEYYKALMTTSEAPSKGTWSPGVPTV